MSAATFALIDRLADVLGPPVYAAPRQGLPGLSRFPCPCCGGGMDDHSELAYRPLVVADDGPAWYAGRVWCDAALERGFGPPTCSFTLPRLARALGRLTEAP